MRSLTKSALALVGLAVVAYVVLFVPLGRYTIYQHAVRIAGTDEAQELGSEAVEAAGRLREHVEGELDEHVRDAGPPDAGPAAVE
ncbi:MAG: hypothetical protein H6722_18385 [Sandaracinus sp.]|nr:hypothetical protein [Myxococcales bacterium]MCB9603505.1 hypothetical protein [Sandaracinus sp.]MCB9614410.1 hypothetical protein [Sandaracinus sp.]MCB9619352.1 hypothetical protein [Sandaracinus sp.]